MALKHIENEERAKDIEAARAAHKIDAAIELGLIPPLILKYIEYLEREWAAENHQSTMWMRKYFECRDALTEAQARRSALDAASDE